MSHCGSWVKVDQINPVQLESLGISAVRIFSLCKDERTDFI